MEKPADPFLFLVLASAQGEKMAGAFDEFSGPVLKKADKLAFLRFDSGGLRVQVDEAFPQVAFSG